MASLTFRFDGKNPASQAAAKRQAAKMITRVSRETKAAIRAIIVRSIREGIAPYDAARSIRELIGLNAPQAQAAETYREHLEESGLSSVRVEKLMETYVARKIRERAKTIARTEIAEALNIGVLEGWRQAQEDGWLPGKPKKEWITTPDEKLCPICGALEGKRVGLNANFSIGRPGPPAHPRCRCSMSVVP